MKSENSPTFLDPNGQFSGNPNIYLRQPRNRRGIIAAGTGAGILALAAAGGVIWSATRSTESPKTLFAGITNDDTTTSHTITPLEELTRNPYDRHYTDRNTNYYGKYLIGDIESGTMQFADEVDAVISVARFKSSVVSSGDVVLRRHPATNNEPELVAPNALNTKDIFLARVSGYEYDGQGTAGSVRASLNGGEKRVGVWYMTVKLVNTDKGLKPVPINPITGNLLGIDELPFVMARNFFDPKETLSLKSLNEAAQMAAVTSSPVQK